MANDLAGYARAIASLVVLLAANLLYGPILQGADESEPLSRIRSMTRDQREALVRNLARFDDLPREEKDAVRELDSKLAGLEPEVRNRYMAILLRYHTIYNSLPDDRRKELSKLADPNDKLKKLVEFLEERRKATAAEDAKYADDLQWSSLAPRRLHQTARELIVWFSLDQPEDAKLKAEYARTKDPVKRKSLVDDTSRKRRGLTQQLRQEFGEFLTDEELFAMHRDFRVQEAKIRAEVEIRVRTEIQREEKKKANLKGETAEEKKKRVAPEAERLTVLYMTRERENFLKNWVTDHMKKLEPEAMRAHDNARIDPANLARFEQALPPWAWESIDFMPPDAAKRRLKVLYRLVFPNGKEMPMPKAAASKPAVDKPKPAAPPTPPGAGPKPF